MPRRPRAALAAVPDAGRTADGTGRFAKGNRAAAQLVLLDGLDPSQAAEWMRPYLARAQSRWRGLKCSGLMRRTGSRLDGLGKQACWLDAQAEALMHLAATSDDTKAARELMTEARQCAREARTAWGKLLGITGVRYQRGAVEDPLAALASELGGDDDA